jgi:hypothetical protein
MQDNPNPDLQFVLRLSAPELTPARIAINDLAELLRVLYAGMRDVARHSGSESCDGTEPATISLIELSESGSTSLAFQSPNADAKDLALKQIGGHLRNVKTRRRNARVDTDTRRVLQRLGSVVQLFPGVDIQGVPIIEVEPEVVSPVRICGETTVYGILDRVGGVSPAARLRLYDGEYLTVYLQSAEMARQLAQRLYEDVGFLGTATWELPDMILTRFQVDEVFAYGPTSVSTAFVLLAEAGGPEAWAVDDIRGAVAELRGDGADEW